MPVRHDDAAARLAAIVESSEDAIFSADLDGVVTSWNAAAVRMFGYTLAEAIGRSIRTLIPADRQAEEEGVLARVRDGHLVEPYETIRTRKDGTVVQVALTASPIRDGAGHVVGISKIARDVTERARIEREALRLAAIVESTDDAIISKDLNGIIQTWNKGAERMFGFLAEEVIGRSILIIIPQERIGEEDEVLRRIRAGQAVEHFETVRRRKNGEPIDISLTISPIYKGKLVIGASKIARDVTAQRRMREQTEEANRLKDEFLATLSHELRTPLNTIVGYAKMLRQGMMEEPQRSRAIDVIYRNGETLTQLVDELLDMSRIVTGKIRLDVEECDLSAVAHESAENIRPSTDVKRLTLRTSIAPGVTVLGDPDRLQQVLWNLLTNAVKFTPAGGRIDLELSIVDHVARLTVRDTGIGLSAASLALVFQRFWQAQSVHSRDHSGLGLGLALVRHFVELHGGTITAKSAGTGKGAEFCVDLPLSGTPPLQPR